jgi:hypothetical protein
MIVSDRSYKVRVHTNSSCLYPEAVFIRINLIGSKELFLLVATPGLQNARCRQIILKFQADLSAVSADTGFLNR